MPLLDETALQPGLFTPFAQTPVSDGSGETVLPDGSRVLARRPSMMETLGAAFEQDNTVVSTLNYLGYLTSVPGDQYDNSYNAWDDIKGTPYEDRWSTFVESNSSAQTAILKSRIDKEEENRRTLSAAGAGGVLASFAAGLADPTIFIPVGGEIRFAGSGMWKVSEAALNAGKAGLIGSAASEAILHGTQTDRTVGESMVTVGTSTVLSALLGAGVARFLTRAEEAAAGEALGRIATGEGAGGARGVGAEAVDQATTADLTVAGGAARAVADTTKLISPNMRANFRAASRARRFSQELAENTLYQDMHADGRSLGPSAETMARQQMRSMLLQGTQAHNDLFSQMKKAGINMTRQEFEEAVGRAMRRADVGDNEFVSQAAQAWRQRVFDPLKTQAVDLGLLPPDVPVVGAESYFSRVWNKERLTAFEPDFKDRVGRFFEGVLRNDYESSTEALTKRQSQLQQEIDDLRMDPEQRTRTMNDLQAAGEKLDAANGEHIDRVSRINDLRRIAKDAAERGDTFAEKAARSEITRIQDEGGEGLKTYLSDRRKLRGRFRRVDLNYAGMSERADQVLTALADNEEKNLRSLQRIVQKGRKLEREMTKLDPRKLSERMSDLRTSFVSLAETADKAIERAQQALAKDAEKAKADPTKAGDLDAAARQRIEREIAAQQKRSERLNSIARRLEVAESLDPTMSMIELKASVDDLVMETSSTSLARGGRAERLKERLARLDPKLLDEKIKALEAAKARLAADHNGRWATKLDVNSAAPTFAESARDIANDVFDKLTGRDFGNGGSTFPEYMTPITRGPLKDRTFNVPDELIEDFLESNALTVAERYGRTMSSEVELTRRFGRADMRDQILEIRQEYGDLRDAVAQAPDVAAAAKLIESRVGSSKGKTKEALLKFLREDEKGAITDLEGMRDLIRGTYKATEAASNYGRLARGVMAFNYIRNMGGALIANFTEVYRPAMVHGLRRYLGQGIAPLLTNLNAVKMSVKEAQLAGQVTERVLQNRLMDLGEIGDPYRQGSAMERWLQNGSRVASRWNGLVYWTDAMKSISSVLSQNRILEGALKGKDTRLLAYLGIDRDMAARVARQFAEHGEVMDGVHVANTEKWADEEAMRAFRGAVSKDVDSIIVTKSVGDVPLFANTPTGKMLLQFRNYNISAHQRVMLRGMQEAPHRFITGLVAMTSIGMLAATLRAWRGGDDRWSKFKEAASNPGYLIGEGLDASGIFALPVEVGNTIEKTSRQWLGTTFNPIKTPLMAAGKLVNPDASMQGESVRFSERGPLGAILGPTASGFEQMLTAGGAVAQLARGEEPSKKQIRAAEAMLPFGSYLGMREVLQALTGDSPYLSDEGEPAR